MNEQQFNQVNSAFSKQAPIFDTIDESNPIIVWMRNIIRKQVLNYVTPGMHLLELNAGTGLDATYFAHKGIYVYATDLSDGMIAQIKEKITTQQLQNYLQVQQCSYTHLNEIKEKNFDHIFSNFGGLNCIQDLSTVTQQANELLKIGGRVTFVIMPKICPWEIASIVKGNTKMAFRRLKNKGAQSHLEGNFFTSYYFNPREIKKAFGNSYELISLVGLASISPPPYKEKWAIRNPNTYRFLAKLDEHLMKFFPFNTWADHIMITMQKTK